MASVFRSSTPSVDERLTATPMLTLVSPPELPALFSFFCSPLEFGLYFLVLFSSTSCKENCGFTFSVILDR